MQAVVFKGPFTVAVEQRPIPRIQHPNDAIVKVQYTALCGSELHVYRGHQKSETDFIMGHEFIGEIHEAGPGLQDIKKGDCVIAPFAINCGSCFYCKRGMSSRCVHSSLFGPPALDGGQAEFVRVPLADSSLVHAPNGIDKKKLVLMADIFPTGYFAALNAFKGLPTSTVEESLVLIFGCGPVGLFALISARSYRPKHLIAVDKVPSRLQMARALGAETWNLEDGDIPLKERVMKLTDGRGADIVIEVVGHADALRMGFDLLRPFGRISSVGIHNENIPWTGNEGYGKNLSIQMGRCPVRSGFSDFTPKRLNTELKLTTNLTGIFKDALEMFIENQADFDFMTTDVRPLSQAKESFDDFDKMRSQKIILVPGK
ncbi:probable zinc-containing alcohol dehydrogenase [Fusarium mangiferae]|uniref:Probable zinc-containing alcohol dehydrogenase n=1 Tax=Fusarium mangiferae TaxID=192010 RepID=A0A1L7TD70_FUSMA|nr:putative zinc-containing alcohol dehydrogenase [Fusarium mangiferae]CVK96554.1 probable zinc-containing alcohol dehydrogenase [Fusarium mangiferae]